jgi:hypothetical protein
MSNSFKTYREAVASTVPDHHPSLWMGVVRVIPNYEPGCIVVTKSSIRGNSADGYTVDSHDSYRAVVAECPSFDQAMASVNRNAGDRDTGWYTEEALITGLNSHDGRHFRVTNVPGFFDITDDE